MSLDLPAIGPADCAAHVHIAAHHWRAPQFESFTPGLGVLCRRAHDPALLGGVSLLRNSRNMPALYAFAGYQPLQIGSTVRVGAIAGLRTRAVFRVTNNANWTWNPATFDHNDVAPFGAAVASWRWRPGSEAHLMVMPAIKNVTPATAGVSVSWAWK